MHQDIIIFVRHIFFSFVISNVVVLCGMAAGRCMQTNCGKLSCRFEHIRGNFCGFSAFIAPAALKRDALFGEIKPDGNNWVFPFLNNLLCAFTF